MALYWLQWRKNCEVLGMKREHWTIQPDYSKENVYRIWDKDGNYHRRTDPRTMDKRARLMECAPAFLAALQSIASNTCCETCQEAKLIAQKALRRLNP